jgi:biotin synthase-related radical SAM superfamily protein
VRLSINQSSPLKLVLTGGGGEVAVIEDMEEIVRGRLEPALCHCPDQAYITMSGRCIYDCKFCPVPKLQGEIKSIEKVVQMVDEAERSGRMKAISLTSSVAESSEAEVKRAVCLLKALRERYDLPIGVSVYPTRRSSEELYAAGATEVKYNLETPSPDIFKRCCPGLSMDQVLRSLEEAVSIFGENRVSSNLIIGLGESDNCIRFCASRLADIGVIPILRPISPHPLRAGEVEVKRPSAERLLSLAKMMRKVLDERGLRADKAETMCLPCTGCDITPHRDV